MSKIETSGESKLGLRLDRILGASASCAAAAAGVGLVGPSESADAAIIHSGPVNIAIPNTADGLYLNLVTGASGVTPATAPPGWDINPYSAVAGQMQLWSQTTTESWLVNGAVGGGTYVHALGAPVGAAQAFGRPASGTNVGAQVTLNADNYFGARFSNEATGAINFAWIKMTFGADAGTRAITEFAYDNTGASIQIGQITAVPEPSTMCLLATGAVGLFAARRRRALAKAKSIA